MTNDLKRSQLRAIQYFYADGSCEFAFGLFCLLLGVYFFVESHVRGWLSLVLDASLVLVVLGGAWLTNRLVRQLKENITWPRTGYVAYTRQHGLRRRIRVVIGMLVGGVVAAAAAALIIDPTIHVATMPLLSGLLLGLVLAILGWRAKLPRFYLLAGLSALAGIALAFSGIENFSGLPIYYLGMSLVLFASGACVLRAYLRQNPEKAGDSDEQ